jgi:hypothetical protein
MGSELLRLGGCVVSTAALHCAQVNLATRPKLLHFLQRHRRRSHLLSQGSCTSVALLRTPMQQRQLQDVFARSRDECCSATRARRCTCHLGSVAAVVWQRCTHAAHEQPHQPLNAAQFSAIILHRPWRRTAAPPHAHPSALSPPPPPPPPQLLNTASQVKSRLLAGAGESAARFVSTMDEFLEGYARCAVAAGISAETFQFNLGTFAATLPQIMADPFKVRTAAAGTTSVAHTCAVLTSADCHASDCMTWARSLPR